LAIRVWNSTDEGVKPHGDSFLSSKKEGRQGYGLLSICTIAEKHGGSASFRWDKSKREFESRVTLSG
jgi:hypothetical protein